jgi:hypothetical protein
MTATQTDSGMKPAREPVDTQLRSRFERDVVPLRMCSTAALFGRASITRTLRTWCKKR